MHANDTRHVYTLPYAQQAAIRAAVRAALAHMAPTRLDLEALTADAMDSRVCDLADTIDLESIEL